MLLGLPAKIKAGVSFMKKGFFKCTTTWDIRAEKTEAGIVLIVEADFRSRVYSASDVVRNKT